MPDTEDPTAPQNLTATAVSPSQIDLAWEASADNVAVTSYQIYRDDVLLTTIGPATTYSDSVIAPATHKYEVRALDAAGNVSAFSNSDTATVTPPDTEPAPASGQPDRACRRAPDHVDLTWDAATDNVGVTEYRVYRDGDLLATLGATTSHTDTTVAPGPHSYEVKAADAADEPLGREQHGRHNGHRHSSAPPPQGTSPRRRSARAGSTSPGTPRPTPSA